MSNVSVNIFNHLAANMMKSTIADKNRDGKISDKESYVLEHSKDVQDMIDKMLSGNEEVSIDAFEKITDELEERREIADKMYELDTNKDGLSVDELAQSTEYQELANIFAGSTEKFSIEDLLNYEKIQDLDGNGEVSATEKRKFGSLLLHGESLDTDDKQSLMNMLQTAIKSGDFTEVHNGMNLLDEISSIADNNAETIESDGDSHFIEDFISTETIINNPDGTYTVKTEPGKSIMGGQTTSKTYSADGKLKKEVNTSVGTEKPYTWTTVYNDDGSYTVTFSNDVEGKDVQWVKSYDKDGKLKSEDVTSARLQELLQQDLNEVNNNYLAKMNNHVLRFVYDYSGDMQATSDEILSYRGLTEENTHLVGQYRVTDADGKIIVPTADDIPAGADASQYVINPNITDNAVFQNGLKDGTFNVQIYETDESKGSSWKSFDLLNSQFIKDTYYTEDDDEAQAEYEVATAQLNSKYTLLETELTQGNKVTKNSDGTFSCKSSDGKTVHLRDESGNLTSAKFEDKNGVKITITAPNGTITTEPANSVFEMTQDIANCKYEIMMSNKTADNQYNTKDDAAAQAEYDFVSKWLEQGCSLKQINANTIYVYDTNNNLVEVRTDKNNDGNAEYTYSANYDDNGKLVSSVVNQDVNSDGKVDLSSTESYTYDENGNKLTKQSQDDYNNDGVPDSTNTYVYSLKGYEISLPEGASYTRNSDDTITITLSDGTIKKYDAYAKEIGNE